MLFLRTLALCDKHSIASRLCLQGRGNQVTVNAVLQGCACIHYRGCMLATLLTPSFAIPALSSAWQYIPVGRADPCGGILACIRGSITGLLVKLSASPSAVLYPLQEAAQKLRKEDREEGKSRKWRRNYRLLNQQLIALEEDEHQLELSYPQVTCEFRESPIYVEVISKELLAFPCCCCEEWSACLRLGRKQLRTVGC